MAAEVKKKLEQSFATIREYFSPSRRQEVCGNIVQLVLFAEHAAKNGCRSIALDSLKLYHSMDPSDNQFLIRAHLCEALVIADVDNPFPHFTEEKLAQALECILKAVSIASKSECYYFFGFNASVLMWRICRHFQRPGARRLFAKPLRVVVKALSDCKIQDHEWKLELLMGLILCQLDAGQKDEASKSCMSAIQLARKYVPDKMMDLIRLHASYNLGDAKQFEKEIKLHPNVDVVLKLSKIKYNISQQGLAASELEQRLRKVFKLLSKEVSAPKSALEPPFSIPQDFSLLLELGFLSLENSIYEVARDCLHELPSNIEDNPQLFIRKQILSSQLLIVGGGDGELYNVIAMDTRIRGIALLEEALMSARRLSDPDTIQLACVALWNVSLPLLQPNLRHVLNRPFTSLAHALEGIQSLLYEMRVEVHFELAKICAQMNQMQAALDHLTKATALDTNGKYAEELKQHTLKYTLRTKIYVSPESDTDKATKIMEQCESLMNDGMSDQLSPLLIKTGDILAPKFFTLALDGTPISPDPNLPLPLEANSVLTPLAPNSAEAPSSNSPREPGEKLGSESSCSEPIDPVIIDALRAKIKGLRQYQVVSHYAESHLSELGDLDYNRRCQLWGELAKIARKKEVWGVASTASIFCLQYERSGRWNEPSLSLLTQSKSTINERFSSAQMSQKLSSISTKAGRFSSPFIGQVRVKESQSLSEDSQFREELKITRTLARVHCILAECFVHQLQEEGLSLGQKPQPSVLRTKVPSDLVFNEDWLSYTELCSTLTTMAHQHFLDAAKIGLFLGDPLLVSNVAVYLWNYNHHLIESNSLVDLIPTYRVLLAAIRKLTNFNDGEIVVRVCTVLVGGIAKKWMPVPQSSQSSAHQSTKSLRKSGGRKDKGKKKGQSDLLVADADATPELREAVEVCDYAIRMSENVPMGIRRKLLSAWVQCKQMLQQSIPSKVFGIHELSDGSTQQCQTVVALEIISRKNNKMWEFPSCPTLQEVFSMISECDWTDSLLEVEMWVRLAQMAHEFNNHELVYSSTDKAVGVRGRKITGTTMTSMAQEHFKSRHAFLGPSINRLESELLSLASSLKGQSLVATSNGRTGVIRRALEAFQDSARFGCEAGSYESVIRACSQYWNTSRSLSRDPLERELLREPLLALLDTVAPLIPHKQNKEYENFATKPSKKDLSLLLSICGAVFQAYIDKQAWAEGLQAYERAVWMMPKTLHRDLVHYKLIFKSRLGRSVESDMIRFQDEPRLVGAFLWHTAAINAIHPDEKLSAFQNAIQTLNCTLHPWTMVKYLLELSEWLYRDQFPVQDAINQLQLVVHILLSIRDESSSSDGEGGNVESEAKHGENKVDDEEAMDKDKGTAGYIAPLPSSSPESISSVVQLEFLLRVHVMLAQLHGTGSQIHCDLCIAALAYCSLIWKLIFNSYSKFNDSGKPSTGQQLPISPREWAEFEFPEEMVDYMKDSKEVGCLNGTSIRTPMLTLYYLDVLVKFLSSLGLHPLLLPVLNLELAISLTVLSNATALNTLLHMQIAQICEDIGLESGVTLHSEKIRAEILDPNDLARSHVEMQIFQAKKEVLALEESRCTLNPSKSFKNTITTSKSTSTQPSSLAQPPTLQYQPYSVGDELVLREVWVKQARLLIQQCQYSKARELLNQAKLASLSFNDQHTLFQIHIYSGLLAATEKDIQMAVSYLTDALKLPCHLDSLLEGVLLLSEVILENSDYKDQYSAILEHMIKLVDTISAKHRNELSTISKYTHFLKIRMHLHSLRALLDESNTLSSKTKSRIHDLCATIRNLTNLLMKLGHHREASPLLQEFAGMYRRLSEKVGGAESKEYLLQALALYQKATDSLLTCYYKAAAMCSCLEDMVSPLKYELVISQLNLAEIFLMIFKEYSNEMRKIKIAKQQQTSIQKIIDDFVRETPVINSVEKEWIATASIACDKTLNLLESVHVMTKNNSKLKAKCIYLVGHCLHLMSEHSSPDAPAQWNEVMPVNTSSDETEGENDDEDKMVSAKYSTVSLVVRKKEAERAELDESASLGSMAQAIHAFTEVVSIAVSNGELKIGMKAALELVDCVGKFEPSLSSLYLAFYQSLAFSMEMTRFLGDLMCDPQSSQLGALLRQREKLIEFGSSESPEIKANTSHLSKFEVFRNLSILANHLEILRSFPPNFRFIVLQHSSDKSQLYAAYLIPPQPPPPSGHKKGQHPVEIEHLEPRVSSAKVSSKDLTSLKDLMAEYQYQASVSQSQLPQFNVEVEGLLRDTCTGLASYLSEVLQPIDAGISKENSNKELCVVILADTDLLSLPLESLPLLQKENICSVTRDFSMQMLMHRMAKNLPDRPGSDLKATPKATPKTTPKATTRKESSKKKEKYNSPISTIPANISTFKYILDPTNCMTEWGSKNPSSDVLTQIQKFPKITGKWTGFSSVNSVMSASRWSTLLEESTGIVFFGTERILTHFPAESLVLLNLPKCSFALIMDLMATPQSTVQQSKLDFNKSGKAFYFEQPVQTAMLLSMTGVGCVLANQWYTSVQNNLKQTNFLINGLLSEATTVGKVHHQFTTINNPSHQENESISTITPMSVIYNCVVYGIPHITLLPVA